MASARTSEAAKVSEALRVMERAVEPEITPQPQTPRIVSSVTSQELARTKAEDFVKNIANEGLAALERLRQEVDNGTIAMQEQQAALAAEILKFYEFTADTINAVRVMESEMVTITNHFKPQQK